MPAFRQRPLTWLFWIATASLNVVGLFRYPEAEWFSALLWAQLYLIAGWAAVGGGHRLARGAALATMPLAMAFVVHVSQRSVNEGPAVLAISLVFAGLMFIATLTFSAILRSLPKQQKAIRPPWQISLSEILGWTIVVALLSWGIHLSELPPLEHFFGVTETLLSVIPASLTIALFVAPARKHDRISLVVALLVQLAYFAIVDYLDNFDLADQLPFVLMLGYLVLWVVVLRLDEAAAISTRPEPFRHEPSEI